MRKDLLDRALGVTQRGKYEIGMVIELSDRQQEQLLDLVQRPPQKQNDTLAGRGTVIRGHIDLVGRVVVKRYHRGGMLRHFVSSWYLRSGHSRAREELQLMQLVGQLGGNVPTPIAYVNRGHLLYQTWLVTREVESEYNLAQLSRIDPERAEAAVPRLVQDVKLLIENDIVHVDLHPGNVLIKKDGKVILVDFDKAKRSSGTKVQLREQYLRRWRRAVIKHDLPESLSELFCAGLLCVSSDGRNTAVKESGVTAL